MAKIPYLHIDSIIPFELLQRSEEGIDVMILRDRWERIVSEGEKVAEAEKWALYDELTRLPVPDHLKIDEPDELSKIRSMCPSVSSKTPRIRLSPAEISDRIAGGWFARCAGCLLGKPVEKIPRSGIREILESNHTWPLTDYITARGIPAEVMQNYSWNRHSGVESLRENITCMPEDDDINYTLLNLYVAETFGYDFTTEYIADSWLSMLPVLSTFTAERVAYVNYLHGIQPPATASIKNPFREWIGAQIRADLWGWIAPGDPVYAAELAWRDARLSHCRNGIYAEMFYAAVIAAAFTTDDPEDLLAIGLSQIPQGSRFSYAIRETISICKNEAEWEAIVDRLYERFGRYHWVHAINNGALVAAALLNSAGDYERAICQAVMAGWDTDCNGATVGSIIGTILGAKRLPGKWIAPLNNRIRSSLKGFDNVSIDEVVYRTAKLATNKDK